MTLAVPSEAEVQAELWLSFISVLKSYASLSSIEGDPALIRNLDDSPCSVIWSTLCSGGRRRCGLRVSYEPSDLRGNWRVSVDDEPFRVGKHTMSDMKKSLRPFTLNLDGTVSFDDGGVLDMDHAAIEMVGFFASAVKRGEVEVPA